MTDLSLCKHNLGHECTTLPPKRILFQDDTRLLLLLQNARVIGKLSQGQKLETSTPEFSVSPTEWYSGIRRRVRGEDRSKNLDAVCNLVKELNENYHRSNASHSSKNTDASTILLLMENIIQGLKVLMATYVDDCKTSSRASTLVDKINRLLLIADYPTNAVPELGNVHTTAGRPIQTTSTKTKLSQACQRPEPDWHHNSSTLPTSEQRSMSFVDNASNRDRDQDRDNDAFELPSDNHASSAPDEKIGSSDDD
jgi:hypothetical protein